MRPAGPRDIEGRKQWREVAGAGFTSLMLDDAGLALGVLRPVCKLRGAAFGILDNSPSEGVERGHTAFQLVRIDAQLPSDPLLQLVGCVLVGGEDQDLFRIVDALLQYVGDLSDHGRGLARAGGGDKEVVVLKPDACLSLFFGE